MANGGEQEQHPESSDNPRKSVIWKLLSVLPLVTSVRASFRWPPTFLDTCKQWWLFTLSICLSTLSTATMSPCCLSPFHPYSTNRVSVIWPDPAAWSADQGKDKFVEVCTAYFVVRLYRSGQTRHYAPPPLVGALHAWGKRGHGPAHLLLSTSTHAPPDLSLLSLSTPHYSSPALQIYPNFHFQHLQRLSPHSSGVGCEDSVFISCDDS